MQRSKLLLILGIILGLIIMGTIGFLLGQSETISFWRNEPSPGVQPTTLEDQSIPSTEVIVALQPIPPGAQFVEGSIGRRPWPVDAVPPDVIQDEIETIGMVAKTEIVQGQIIMRAMLAEKAGVIPIIVALEPISRGTVILEGSIGRREDWPADYVPPDIIANEAEAIGMVARMDIVPGQAIGHNLFMKQSGFYPAKTSPPAIVNGIAYFGQNEFLYAIEVETGQVLWRFEADYPVTSTPTIVDDVVYVVDDVGYFYGLDIGTGRELWYKK